MIVTMNRQGSATAQCLRGGRRTSKLSEQAIHAAACLARELPWKIRLAIQRI
jgi:hypothetical protein